MYKPVRVTVWTDDEIKPKEIKITVSEEPVTLDSTLHNGIEWTLEDSPGWSFTKKNGHYNGIQIKQQGTKFRHHSSDKTKHKWDRVTGGGARYTISVTNDAHPDFILTWDPSIMND